MPAAGVHFSSLDRVTERVLDHLRQGHHTALVGSPGCGITTFVTDLAAIIAGSNLRTNRFDARVKSLTDLAGELAMPRAEGSLRQVVILEHAGYLANDDFRRLLAITSEASAKNRDICLWCGNVDARGTDRDLGTKLCSVPSAHISFPVLSRDELLNAYRQIAAANGCRWGDAVLYLMLDLCGTELTLVASITDYLHGDWSDKLYDESVWDRIQDWLSDADPVDLYRSRLAVLKEQCAGTLALLRFGGKPRCLRSELIEETDDGLRLLCLNGFLIPNLLPGFYQLRNLVARFLLDETVSPELHFRRATNERASVLIQDAETMLRQVLGSAFASIGINEAKKHLEKMQQPGDVIEEKLHSAILKWSRENVPEASHKALSSLILDHRNALKIVNSVWSTTQTMMERDNVADDGSRHIQSIDYLTFDQLGQLVLLLKEAVFPRLQDGDAKKQKRDERFKRASEPGDLIENWREGVAKLRRLRNQVAHLRNVGFQDMEDLAATLERMRLDVILYGGWKEPPASADVASAEVEPQPA